MLSPSPHTNKLQKLDIWSAHVALLQVIPKILLAGAQMSNKIMVKKQKTKIAITPRKTHKNLKKKYFVGILGKHLEDFGVINKPFLNSHSNSGKFQVNYSFEITKIGMCLHF